MITQTNEVAFSDIMYYQERGRNILSSDKWAEWNRIIPIVLNNMYGRDELGYALDVIRALKEDVTYDKVMEIIDSQGHSALSYITVLPLVEIFYDNGKEFVNYVKQR